MLLKVLRGEVGVHILHYSPLCTPTLANYLVTSIILALSFNKYSTSSRPIGLYYKRRRLLIVVVSYKTSFPMTNTLWLEVPSSVFVKNSWTTIIAATLGCLQNNCHPQFWMTLWKSSTLAFLASISNPHSLMPDRLVTKAVNRPSASAETNQVRSSSDEEDPLGSLLATDFLGAIFFFYKQNPF